MCDGNLPRRVPPRLRYPDSGDAPRAAGGKSKGGPGPSTTRGRESESPVALFGAAATPSRSHLPRVYGVLRDSSSEIKKKPEKCPLCEAHHVNHNCSGLDSSQVKLEDVMRTIFVFWMTLAAMTGAMMTL